MAHIIDIVGIGPGAEEYLTPKALEIINKADILIGGQRNLEPFAGLRKKNFVIGNNLKEMISFIKENHYNEKIAILASGDPGLYGIVSYLGKNFEPAEINVIPGISSVQLAFARLKMPWQDAVILSTHGRDLETVIELLKTVPKAALFTDAKASPEVIARELLKYDPARKKAWVCTNLSYPDEIIKEFTLPELAIAETNGNNILILKDI